MLFSRKTALWLGSLPSTLAIDCTASNASVVELTSGGGDSGSGSSSTGDFCSVLCGNDASCLIQCYANEATVGAIKVRNLNSRATLSCTSSETCITIVDLEGVLMCIDINTGVFHDGNGGNGNFITGEYTEASGQKTTVGVEGSATATSAPFSASPSTSGVERLSGHSAIIGALGLLVSILVN